MKWFFYIIFVLAINLKAEVPSFNEIKNQFHPSDVPLIDRNNLELELLRTNQSYRSLEWTTIPEISNAFKKYLLISEDKSFFDHHGVDWKAMLSATFERLLNSRSKRGASTLTMQLVNTLNPNLKGIKKNVSDKIDQIEDALKLEKSWNKEQILEAYVNLIPFRGEFVGIRSASFALFKKSPSALNNFESAILVALIRSPNAPLETVALRACRLLNESNCNSIFTKTYKVLTSDSKIERSKKIVNIIDPSFVLKNNLRENSIRTTLSKNIQQTALGALHEQIKNLKDQNLSDGAILVINNSTNEVIAYVANAGDQFSSSPRVDNIRSRRQAGSTLKPFIYAHAIDMNYLTSDSIISDTAIDIPIGLGSIYFPRNYDNSFHGDVPLKVALGSSLNVPAVKTLLLVTGEKIINLFKKLGLKRLEDANYYGPSLALGSVDITLWDLVHAYMGLHNGKNFKKTTEDELFNILSEDENRRLTFGTNSVLAMPFKVAVKTGTSKDMRDNWCIGYSKNYTVGVWVGNSNGKAMWNVSGITGAAPIFRAVMLELEKNNSFNHYLAKTDMDKVNKLEDKSISKIRYPVDGEIIGFDNDIPLSLQKMPIEIENLKSNQKILINGKPIQEKLENYLWPVAKGHFEISLQDENNESIHKIHFEVR